MSHRIGVLSDAHGNASALDACLKFLRKKNVDRILFLGDAVGYFHQCTEVCKQLMKVQALCLMGNHEAMVFGSLPLSRRVDEITRLSRNCGELPKSWRESVKKTGSRQVLEINGRSLLLVHGSPTDPLLGRVDAPEECPAVDGVDVVLMGHTHRPFVHRDSDRLLVNPGSCGLPRDHGGLLSLAVLDMESMNAEVFRIPHKPDKNLKRHAHEDVKMVLTRRCSAPFGTQERMLS